MTAGSGRRRPEAPPPVEFDTRIMRWLRFQPTPVTPTPLLPFAAPQPVTMVPCGWIAPMLPPLLSQTRSTAL